MLGNEPFSEQQLAINTTVAAAVKDTLLAACEPKAKTSRTHDYGTQPRKSYVFRFVSPMHECASYLQKNGDANGV